MNLLMTKIKTECTLGGDKESLPHYNPVNPLNGHQLAISTQIQNRTRFGRLPKQSINWKRELIQLPSLWELLIALMERRARVDSHGYYRDLAVA